MGYVLRTILIVLAASSLAACNASSYSRVSGEGLVGRTVAGVLAPVVQRVACGDGYDLKMQYRYTRTDPRPDLAVTEYRHVGTGAYAVGYKNSAGQSAGHVWVGEVYEVSHYHMEQPPRVSEGFVSETHC